MKRFLLAAALSAAATSAAPSFAIASDVGVSISVGQPGFYGRIDIGSVPGPRLVYAEPLVIHRGAPGGAIGGPVYMHVPPGHAKNWGKHCAKYNACARPVYFVQESWYNDVYVPHYRDEKRGKGHGKGHGKGRKDD